MPEGKRTVHFVAEVLLAVILFAVLSVCHFAVPLFSRGFFCDDQSIQKPYVSKQSVPTSVLLAVGVVLGLGVILLCEGSNYVLFSRQRSLKVDEMKDDFLGCCKFSAWIYRLCSRLWYFAIGMVITVMLTELGKGMVGRLRPHFLAACKPNYSLFNCSDGFITVDYCTGVPKQILEARKSFPSGHSSFSAYVAVFVILYLQFAIRSKEVKLLRPVLQIGVLLLAVACSLSRISDYFHHWSDVLTGFILGTLVAVFVVFVVMDLKTEEKLLAKERIAEGSGIVSDVENYGSTGITMEP